MKRKNINNTDNNPLEIQPKKIKGNANGDNNIPNQMNPTKAMTTRRQENKNMIQDRKNNKKKENQKDIN